MNAVSLSPAQYGYNMGEYLTSPEKFAECFMGTREKFGYDGLYGGLNTGVTSVMPGHLENIDGVISRNGEETIKSLEDLKMLKPYSPDKSERLQKK